MRNIKRLFNIFILLICAHNSSAQEAKKPFLNELTFSGNYSNVQDDSTSNRFGYGFGVFHHSKLTNKVALISGIELNHMSQHKNSFFDGESVLYSDVTFNFNAISLRCFPRIRLGEKIAFIIEAGPQADIGIFSHYKGESGWFFHGTQPGSSELDNVKIKYGFNIYGCTGLGITFTSGKSELIFKTEYKIGLTKDYYDQSIRHRYIYFSIGMIKRK